MALMVILTADDVSKAFPRRGKQLSVSPDSVRLALSNGELGGRKIGKQWFTTEAAVMRWVEGLPALKMLEPKTPVN